MLRRYSSAQRYLFHVETSAPVSISVSLARVRFFTSLRSGAPEVAASTSSSVTAAPIADAAPPLTYFNILDQLWNRQWIGTVDAVAVSNEGAEAVSNANSLFSELFIALQDALGVEAGVLILLLGGLTRLCTLVFSLYGERASERMRLALPELQKPQEEFNSVYYNDLASSMEVQMAASRLKGCRRQAFAKHKTSLMQCMAALASTPVVMTGMYQVSSLCSNPALPVGTSSFAWCSALTFPDPFFILPTAFCALTLLNFELSIFPEMKKGWMLNFTYAARMGCLCVIPVAATFRAGVCLYCIGMSLVGLSQPLLLRSAAFRRQFHFPPLPAATAVVKTDDAPLRMDLRTKVQHFAAAGDVVPDDKDPLRARMMVQFPYLSHLLSPQLDEHEALFKKSGNAAPQGKRYTATSPLSGKEASTGRYAMGTNPLMREVPAKQRTSDGVKDRDTRRKTSSKGTSFASGGWKTEQKTFDEADYIPSFTDSNTTKSNLARPSPLKRP